MAWSELFSSIGSLVGVFGNIKKSQSAEEVSEANAAKTINYYKFVAEEKQRTAEANAKIYDYDSLVAVENAENIEYATHIALQRHTEKVTDLISTQRAQFANSGVSVSEGTPVTVVANTAAKGARDAMMIKYNGDVAANVQKSLAKRYRLLKETSLNEATYFASKMLEVGADEASSILMQGEIQSDAALINAATSATAGTYNIGKMFDWWK